jgi:hypothetical protein
VPYIDKYSAKTTAKNKNISFSGNKKPAVKTAGFSVEPVNRLSNMQSDYAG